MWDGSFEAYVNGLWNILSKKTLTSRFIVVLTHLCDFWRMFKAETSMGFTVFLEMDSLLSLLSFYDFWSYDVHWEFSLLFLMGWMPFQEPVGVTYNILNK